MNEIERPIAEPVPIPESVNVEQAAGLLHTSPEEIVGLVAAGKIGKIEVPLVMMTTRLVTADVLRIRRERNLA